MLGWLVRAAPDIQLALFSGFTPVPRPGSCRFLMENKAVLLGLYSILDVWGVRRGAGARNSLGRRLPSTPAVKSGRRSRCFCRGSMWKGHWAHPAPQVCAADQRETDPSERAAALDWPWCWARPGPPSGQGLLPGKAWWPPHTTAFLMRLLK